jgi:hypothetical protein
MTDVAYQGNFSQCRRTSTLSLANNREHVRRWSIRLRRYDGLGNLPGLREPRTA